MISESGKLFFKKMLESEKAYKFCKGDKYKIAELKDVLYRESCGENIKGRHEAGLLKCAVMSFVGRNYNHDSENDHLTGVCN